MNTPEYEIYPLTIVSDRYSGAYSGGDYTAWNLQPFQIPEDIFAGDVECMWFWEVNKIICGKGRSPEAAIVDLQRKLKEVSE